MTDGPASGRAPRVRSRGSAARVLLVAGALGLALFGSLLLVFTPSLEDHPGIQTLWVVASLVLLKLPLLLIVWWLIVRSRGRTRPGESPAATAAVVARATRSVSRSRDGLDPAEDLESLRQEVWALAAHADPASAQRLVDLALEMERLVRRRPPPRMRGGPPPAPSRAA